MTALRQKMIEDMQLRGFAFRTQEAYLLGVRQLARYYNKSPDLVTEDELRQFFFVSQERQAYCAQHLHHRPVRNQVLLPTYPRSGVEDL